MANGVLKLDDQIGCQNVYIEPPCLFTIFMNIQFISHEESGHTNQSFIQIKLLDGSVFIYKNKLFLDGDKRLLSFQFIEFIQDNFIFTCEGCSLIFNDYIVITRNKELILSLGDSKNASADWFSLYGAHERYNNLKAFW